MNLEARDPSSIGFYVAWIGLVAVLAFGLALPDWLAERPDWTWIVGAVAGWLTAGMGVVVHDELDFWQRSRRWHKDHENRLKRLRDRFGA